ncbi:MAG TPA: endolytic transglycosylase MltG [Pseudonocardia sp.]|nr:endolytic transglycosylase MltG [Pseudonocardia sp.]
MNDTTDTVPIRLGLAPEPRPHRGRAGLAGLVIVVLVAVIAGGGWYLYDTTFAAPDFEGPGEGPAVVQVAEGATTRQIGTELARGGVVASVEAFLRAAEEEPRIRTVQPGYYRMRERMSAAAAVALLLDPAARVGRLEIRGGMQLDDTTGGDGSVAPGVLTLISRASCAGAAAAPTCVSVDELRTAMAETDPAQLGVPEWALAPVRAADAGRRLEGLLAPGLYDVAPDTGGGVDGAAEILRSLLEVSTARFAASNLVAGAEAAGLTPYEALTAASLVEKEAITADMPKVARVIYNRLDVGQRLELDSTVNYPLDRQTLRTTAEDRSRVGPYNSYAVAGLPPTPIAAPGQAAIAAALEPADGPWLFFVRCEPDGTSCFATTLAEHDENIATAIANGAFGGS